MPPRPWPANSRPDSPGGGEGRDCSRLDSLPAGRMDVLGFPFSAPAVIIRSDARGNALAYAVGGP
jgi:hypothetical protein